MRQRFRASPSRANARFTGRCKRVAVQQMAFRLLGEQGFADYFALRPFRPQQPHDGQRANLWRHLVPLGVVRVPSEADAPNAVHRALVWHDGRYL